MNRYLSPSDLSADEADRLLTQAGFPIEGHTPLPGGEVRLDVEVTSNRGDCLSHVGCAREVAAMDTRKAPRELVMPEFRDPQATGAVSEALALENREPDACPLFTARVIRGCKIGPSPTWLVEALEALGQRPINNVVDISNFITLELGNPCHVFDLGKLAGGRLVVRYAKDGEKLTTLDGKARTLGAGDLVVADAERATSLAGVMGGKDSEVNTGTTDVVFEMATWNPVAVRTSSRRHAIRTDASHRFERGVHPATIEDAARRAVALICELTGGKPCKGVLAEGAAPPDPVVLTLRPSRVRLLVGVEVPAGEMIAVLRRLEIATEQVSEDELRCVVPAHRLDLTREVDLIEEVARARGLDAVPATEKLTLRPRPLQASERAQREIGRVLTGLGFFETVTFSFVRPAEAALFLASGMKTIEVDDDRRKAEPTLRPSVLAGLLGCRRSNRDAGVSAAGGVRLYEVAESFMQTARDETVEGRTLAMVLDVPVAGRKASDNELQHGIRLMRGALDALVLSMFGPGARTVAEASTPESGAWHAQAHARLWVETGDGRRAEVARFGLVSDAARKAYDLDEPVAAAEVRIDDLIAPFPPRALATRLPAFPGIERDLSLVVDEQVTWAQIDELVRSLEVDRLTSWSFVGTFRSEQLGAGLKSVTIRLAFRDPDRTLRREEVDPQVNRVAEAAGERLNAKIRA